VILDMQNQLLQVKNERFVREFERTACAPRAKELL
jgi:hypothetical protein